MKYVYPAIFAKDGDYIAVSFPDIHSCITSGNSLENAIEMAQDALCLVLYDMEQEGIERPQPSSIASFSMSSDSFPTLISCDTDFYRAYFANKSVKKTLTLPQWLNDMAEKRGINFSAVLQEALKQKLSIP